MAVQSPGLKFTGAIGGHDVVQRRGFVVHCSLDAKQAFAKDLGVDSCVDFAVDSGWIWGGLQHRGFGGGFGCGFGVDLHKDIVNIRKWILKWIPMWICFLKEMLVFLHK